MKLKFTLALCLLALVMMTGCSDDDNGVGHDSNLVGIWDITHTTIDGEEIEFPFAVYVTFNADGTGSWNIAAESEAQTWSTSGSNLTMSLASEGSMTGTYSISGSTMIFTFTDNGNTVVYTFSKRPD